MRARFRWLRLPVLATCVAAWCSGASAAAAAPAGISVSCYPVGPTVAQDGAVRVRAWASPGSGSLGFVWSTTAGTLAGHMDEHGSEAVWSFEGSLPGTYTATVQVADAEGRFATCSLRVQVNHRTRGTAVRIIRGALLERDEVEGPGYGLYSYVLMGTKPDESSRERLRAALDAYARIIDSVLDLEQPPTERASLNMTYVPVRDLDPEGSPDGQQLLEHYDHARAKRYLERLGGMPRLRGPYLVSCPIGLDKPGDHSGHRHIFQDLSWVPPRLAALWVEAFVNQAAQVRYWETPTLERLVLGIRTTIEVAAIGLPDVRAAVEEWIEWPALKGSGSSP